MDAPPPPVVAQEIRLVDAHGHLRLLLSVSGAAPVIAMLREDGSTALQATLGASGQPSVTLSNTDPAGPHAALAVDDKGAHVKFDGPGQSSSDLFLNDAGLSGLVLVDGRGLRRYGVVLGADGVPRIDAAPAEAADRK